MFLTIDDYKPVCSSRELEILQQSDTLTRERAERVAIEEVASYLRNRYDTERIFAAEGDERNAHLVQICVNVVLFYLVQWLPAKMASANRTELYEYAIEWLKSVQAGKATPDLPTPQTDGEGKPMSSFPAAMGGFPKSRYDW